MIIKAQILKLLSNCLNEELVSKKRGPIKINKQTK